MVLESPAVGSFLRVAEAFTHRASSLFGFTTCRPTRPQGRRRQSERRVLHFVAVGTDDEAVSTAAGAPR